ncbi:hypothetical protein HU200_057280 [Digitaria exilis]|uniref:Uncharacterized protein n=1 Tax=Digitaria exilis TaxID=1010633 RepID=A0A835AEF7_9POAL|nr:hypothetical protein HU200_057280 [Digitaria exilis]
MQRCLLSHLSPLTTDSLSKTRPAEYVDEYWKARRLEKEKTRLSNEKRELERKLADKTRAVQVSSGQVSTLVHKVQELEHQNAKLSSDLVKQRENTRKAGLVFMDAADRYQQVAKNQIRAKISELEDTRKASLLLMNAADAYQDVAKKQSKAKMEELEDTRKAVLVLMSAADTYQQEAKKHIMEKVEELKILGAQKAEMDAKVECLESALSAAVAKNWVLEVDRDEVMEENRNLRLEVERLMVELEALVEGEAAAIRKAF